MTDATATLIEVISFDARVFTLCDYRRVTRGVVIGLGTVAAACALATSVAVAAAWIISVALSTNSYTHARTSIGPGTLALVKYYPTMASATDVPRPAGVLPGSAHASDVTFEAKWARAMAFARASAVPLLLQSSVDRTVNVPTAPHLLEVPHSQAKLEIAQGPDLTQVANLAPDGTLTSPSTNSVALPQPRPAKYAMARSPVGQAAPQVAAATPPPTPIAEKRVTSPQTENKSMLLPGPDSRTAVYDIAAHTVYLPNGERLEAHSGLGNELDDPRYVDVKNRGPTPPNVYNLAMREELFHGVRVIRLNPADDGKMFRRDGMLAHPYMLGPNGQSNGCVSFRDYPKFLEAFLNGEVDRLVVVPNLGTERSHAARARREHVSRYAFNSR
jgi:hypothetical protein